MAPELSDRELLLQIHSAIYGEEEQGGLLREVKGNGRRIWRLEIIVTLILGSGILGGGAAALVRFL